MDCREVFQDSVDPRLRCRNISLEKPECECELESISAYSPGLVSVDEILARLVYSPLHLDADTGEVTEAAFSDVQDKGLSVLRLEHLAGPAIGDIGRKKQADDRAKAKTDRIFLGTVNASVQAIRNLIYDGEGHGHSVSRAFCIYDSGLQHNPAHADVCQTPATRSEMKRARKRLRDIFSRKPTMP